jgi:hypothetical protein
MRMILIIEKARCLSLGTMALIPLLLAPFPAAGAAPTVALEASADPDSHPSLEHGKAFTGDATPVEPGHVEVELAYAPSWWATAGTLDRLSGQQHQVSLATGVGLARDVDARLVVGWGLVQEARAGGSAPVAGSGVADTTLAVRWRFLSLDEPALDLAVSAAVTAPTGSAGTEERPGTGLGTWGIGGAILASADWGRFTASAELGFSAPVGARVSNDVGLLVCNLGVGWQWLPLLQPELELNYQHELESGGEPAERVLWATAAVVLPADPVRLVVGARFPVWSAGTSVGPMATAAFKVAF